LELIYENIKALDGKNIRIAHSHAINPVGVVQFVHGFGEGIEYYTHAVQYFTNHNLSCIIHDQRGFGKMPHLTKRAKGRYRGVVPSYKHFLADVHSVRNYVDRWYDLPVFLYGYSMGGNIAANFLLRKDGEYQSLYKKAVFVVPWINTYRKLPKISEKLASLGGKISPKIKVSSRLNPRATTNNRDEIYGLIQGEVYHDRISLRMYSQIARAGEYAANNVHRLALPTLVIWAGNDVIVCNKAIQDFIYSAKGNVEAKEYPDAYHSVMLEENKDEILGYITNFMKKT